MTNTSQLGPLRTQQKARLRKLAKELLSKDSKTKRSAQITSIRMLHLVTVVSMAFNQAAKRYHKGYWKAPTTVEKLVVDKYAPTALALAVALKERDIQLDKWMMAQVDTLLKMGQVITMFHCYGDPALKRYTDWEAKQQRMYRATTDQRAQLVRHNSKISHTISWGHQIAIECMNFTRGTECPSLSAALYYWFPEIPGWYCIAYECFRSEIMESARCSEPFLVQCWKQYKADASIRRTCRESLEHVINKHGELDWL